MDWQSEDMQRKEAAWVFCSDGGLSTGCHRPKILAVVMVPSTEPLRQPHFKAIKWKGPPTVPSFAISKARLLRCSGTAGTRAGLTLGP